MTTIMGTGRTGDRPASVRGGGLRLAVTTALVVALVGGLTTKLGDVRTADLVWWPAAGVALALAVRRPSRRWWCVAGTLVGSLVAGRVLGLDLGQAVAFAGAQAVQCGTAARLTSALSRGEAVRLRRGGDAWRLAAGAGAGITAATLLVQSAHLPAGLVHPAGQLLGVLLVAPLLLLPQPWAHAAATTRAPLVEWLAVLAVSAALTGSMFLTGGEDRVEAGRVSPWSFLVVLPVLWGAARLGVGRAVTCLLVTALIAIAGTAGGTGPYSELGDSQRSIVLQGLLVTVGAVTIVMSLVVRSRDRAVQEAVRREDLFRRTFDDALLGVALLRLDADGRAVVARTNGPLVAMLGPDARVPVGSDWAAQVHPDQREDFVAAVREMAAEVREGRRANWHAEVRHGDGDVWLELAVAAWPTDGDSGGTTAAVVQVVDVTQRRLVQRRLREAALHDPLTGLPNRTLLEDRLRHALNGANRTGRQVALLYCDLDDFKPVNDTGGHAAGDHVLIGVAERLAAAVRPGDTVARLGGDEFAVVCPDLPDEDAATAVAERVVAAMVEPFAVAGWEFRVGISVGLAMAARGADAQRVLQDADAAMYAAKGSGKGRVRSAVAPVAPVVDLRTAPRPSA